MAQGTTKGIARNKPTSSRHAARAAAPKKGRKVVPPKKAVLIKQVSLHKKLSAKINKSIERQMVDAASSGKLTIMKNATSDETPAKSTGTNGKS